MSFCYIGTGKNAQVQLMNFSYRQKNRRTYIYSPVDKSFSPIISTTCVPNKECNPLLAGVNKHN